MNSRIVRTVVAALAVLAFSYALAQDDMSGMPDAEAPDHGMHMQQDGTTGVMRHMMSHCAGMMEEMHGEAGGHGMRRMHGGSRGMDGMRMMPGMMDDRGPARNFDQTAAEALSRAFVAGAAGVDAGQVEIVEITVGSGDYRVQYRHGSASGTVLVDAETGAVTEAEGG